MAKYRNDLPQLAGDLFLTDGGIETTLIFHEGQELPYFAAFHLLATEEGTEALRKYFRTYAVSARALETGLILETATWRANSDWGERLGYSGTALAEANRKAVDLLQEIRSPPNMQRCQSSFPSRSRPMGNCQRVTLCRMQSPRSMKR